ncbi:MAG TPA: hypothetical protein PKL13_04165 [bacterium]|nr:hypothetical protein [bacterium]
MTKQQKKFILFIGGAIDSIYSLGPDNIKKLFEYFNRKRFRVADTNLTYRQINSLDNNNVLKNDRENERDWHKFSLKELIFFSVIKELRTYGLLDKQLIKLRKAFFDKDLSISSNFALIAILGKVKIILMLDNQMNVYFFDIPMFQALGRKYKSYININLNEVVGDVFEKIGKDRIEYKDELNLVSSETSDEENKILEIIRNKDYKVITITKKGGEKYIVRGKTIQKISLEELAKMMEGKKYVDVNMKQREGDIQTVNIEDIFKI